MLKYLTLFAVVGILNLSSCTFGNKTNPGAANGKNLFGPIQTVEYFGAVPNDGKDDLQAIQRSIDQLGYASFKTGTYEISASIRGVKNGIKLFGISEMLSILAPLKTFRGKYLIDLGNGKVSKHANEVRYLKLDGSAKGNVSGIRFNQINNTSRIQYCYFMKLNQAIVFENSALANTISQNSFKQNRTNIELKEIAGNSTQIINNYFSRGRVFLNGSMSDVKIYGNTFDNDATIYSDGKSGQRGIFISFNRFESSNTGTKNISLGYGRRYIITHNYFTGNGKTAVAIEFRSGYSGNDKSKEQNHTISFNSFERYKNAYISSKVPAKKFNLKDNSDDGSALKFSTGKK